MDDGILFLQSKSGHRQNQMDVSPDSRVDRVKRVSSFNFPRPRQHSELLSKYKKVGSQNVDAAAHACRSGMIRGSHSISKPDKPNMYSENNSYMKSSDSFIRHDGAVQKSCDKNSTRQRPPLTSNSDWHRSEVCHSGVPPYVHSRESGSFDNYSQDSAYHSRYGSNLSTSVQGLSSDELTPNGSPYYSSQSNLVHGKFPSWPVTQSYSTSQHQQPPLQRPNQLGVTGARGLSQQNMTSSELPYSNAHFEETLSPETSRKIFQEAEARNVRLQSGRMEGICDNSPSMMQNSPTSRYISSPNRNYCLNNSVSRAQSFTCSPYSQQSTPPPLPDTSPPHDTSGINYGNDSGMAVSPSAYARNRLFYNTTTQMDFIPKSPGTSDWRSSDVNLARAPSFSHQSPAQKYGCEDLLLRNRVERNSYTDGYNNNNSAEQMSAARRSSENNDEVGSQPWAGGTTTGTWTEDPSYQTSILKKLSQEYFAQVKPAIPGKSRLSSINETSRVELQPFNNKVSDPTNRFVNPSDYRPNNVIMEKDFKSSSNRDLNYVTSDDAEKEEENDDFDDLPPMSSEAGSNFVRNRKSQLSLRKAFGIFEDIEVFENKSNNLPIKPQQRQKQLSKKSFQNPDSISQSSTVLGPPHTSLNDVRLSKPSLNFQQYQSQKFSEAAARPDSGFSSDGQIFHSSSSASPEVAKPGQDISPIDNTSKNRLSSCQFENQMKVMDPKIAKKKSASLPPKTELSIKMENIRSSLSSDSPSGTPNSSADNLCYPANDVGMSGNNLYEFSPAECRVKALNSSRSQTKPSQLRPETTTRFEHQISSSGDVSVPRRPDLIQSSSDFGSPPRLPPRRYNIEEEHQFGVNSDDSRMAKDFDDDGESTLRQDNYANQLRQQARRLSYNSSVTNRKPAVKPPTLSPCDEISFSNKVPISPSVDVDTHLKNPQSYNPNLQSMVQPNGIPHAVDYEPANRISRNVEPPNVIRQNYDYTQITQSAENLEPSSIHAIPKAVNIRRSRSSNHGNHFQQTAPNDEIPVSEMHGKCYKSDSSRLINVDSSCDVVHQQAPVVISDDRVSPRESYSYGPTKFTLWQQQQQQQPLQSERSFQVSSVKPRTEEDNSSIFIKGYRPVKFSSQITPPVPSDNLEVENLIQKSEDRPMGIEGLGSDSGVGRVEMPACGPAEKQCEVAEFKVGSRFQDGKLKRLKTKPSSDEQPALLLTNDERSDASKMLCHKSTSKSPISDHSHEISDSALTSNEKLNSEPEEYKNEPKKVLKKSSPRAKLCEDGAKSDRPKPKKKVGTAVIAPSIRTVVSNFESECPQVESPQQVTKETKKRSPKSKKQTTVEKSLASGGHSEEAPQSDKECSATDSMKFSRRKKSMEENEYEHQAAIVAGRLRDEDQYLSNVLMPPMQHKTTADFMVGLYDIEPIPDLPGTFQRSHATRGSLRDRILARSENLQPDLSKTLSSDYVREIVDENKAELSAGLTLEQEKMELESKLIKKLNILILEKQQLEGEIEENDALGNQITMIAEKGLDCKQFDKYKSYIDELEKVMRLLLKLSDMLARSENAIFNLSQNASDKEKAVLVLKRDDLTQKHSDARMLKESIDRRSQQVAGFLKVCTTEAEFKDYEYFIKTKSRLIVEQREIDDMITLGQTQLKSLRSTMYRNGIESDC